MPQTSNLKLQNPNSRLQTSRPLIGLALAVVTGMAGASIGLFSFGILSVAALGCIMLAGLFIRTKAADLLVFSSVALVSACRFMVAALPLSEAEINRLKPKLPLQNVQLVGRVIAPPEYHAYRSGHLGTWVFTLECEALRGREGPAGRPHEDSATVCLECAGSTALLNYACSSSDLSPFGHGRDPATAGGRPHVHTTGLPGNKAVSSHRTPKLSLSTTSNQQLNNQQLNNQSAWLAKRGRIQVRVTGAPPGEPFRQGARIRLFGTLRRRIFPGGEPVELLVSSSGHWAVLDAPPRFSPSLWGQRIRAAAARTLSHGMEGRDGQLAVYKALLLGYRKAVPPEIHQTFRRTGTLHIFAISGLHVGIVGLLITVVLKTAGLSRDRWGLILLPLLLGYVVTTGMKSSALRALTMAAIFFLAPLFRRKPDIPVSIAFAAILLLLWKPLEICSVGFILSFTVVSFIVMLFATVPKEFIFRGGGGLRPVRAYVLSLGITSMAAFIASAPLAALFFGSFTPVSLVGNLIVVPLTFCIVLSGWLSILVPVASTVFNHAALVFINALLSTAQLLARLPGAHGSVPPPPLMALLFWYGGWIHLFVHARSRRQRTASYVLILLAIALSVL